MVLDTFSKADVLNTTSSCGAPNFRQIRSGHPVFGMGQPSMNGFKQVLHKLQSQGHKASLHSIVLCCVRFPPGGSMMYWIKSAFFYSSGRLQEVLMFCVREEPVVFMRSGDDFVPYTPRRKENLHENLQGLSKNIPVENLELNIRKEVKV